MEASAIPKFLTLGENVCVEFKRGGNGFEDDALQTVCSFLNRFGGDIFLGITDDGEICGVPEKAAPDMVKNFIKRTGDTNLFPLPFFLSRKSCNTKEKPSFMFTSLRVPRFTSSKKTFMTESVIPM